MSYTWSGAVWQASDTIGASLLTLYALADFADEDGISNPRIRTLADAARITDRGARNALSKLKRSGAIEQLSAPTAFKAGQYKIIEPVVVSLVKEIKFSRDERVRRSAENRGSTRRNDVPPSRNVVPSSRNDVPPGRNVVPPSRNVVPEERNDVPPGRNDVPEYPCERINERIGEGGDPPTAADAWVYLNEWREGKHDVVETLVEEGVVPGSDPPRLHTYEDHKTHRPDLPPKTQKALDAIGGPARFLVWTRRPEDFTFAFDSFVAAFNGTSN